MARLEELLPILVEQLEKPRGPSLGMWRAELEIPPTTVEIELLTCVDNRLNPRACLQCLNRVPPGQCAVYTDDDHLLEWVPKYFDMPGP